MNRWYILTLVLALGVPTPGRAASTATFEDINLPAGSFLNNAGSSGRFVSGGSRFNNSVDPTFGSWSGWAISNMTDKTTPGFTNQYSAFPGVGGDGSSTYAVAFASSPNGAFIDLAAGDTPFSLQVTNTTYAALSILNGDQFAKKFGGPSGNDPDFFKLTITGYQGLGAAGLAMGSIDFFLADYRSSDNSQDYVVDDWRTVSLTSLDGVRSLGFSLTSTDVGFFGMNTPAYFALDNLVLASPSVVPAPTGLLLLAVGLTGIMAAGRVRARDRSIAIRGVKR